MVTSVNLPSKGPGWLAVVAAIAILGALGVELLGGLGRDAQALRVQLIELTAHVNLHSALEWQLVAEPESADEVVPALEANEQELGLIADSVLAARGGDSRAGALVEDVRAYRTAVLVMVGQLQAGDVEGASATDEELVDPLSTAIRARTTELLALYATRADQIGVMTRAGTIALLGLALGAVAISSRRANRLEAEHRVEARFRSLIQNASDLITIVAADGTIRYEGPSLERILGYSSEELIGTSYLSLVHPDDRARLELSLDLVRRGVSPPGSSVVVRMSHHDGSWRQFETVLRDLEDEPDIAGIVLTARDTTERERLADRLRHQAEHDELTGLANRKTFLARVEANLGHTDSSAVLFIDLDDFKGINDNLGHTAADRVLMIIAERVRRTIRPVDLAARLGGDEFGILLAGIEPGHGPEVAAKRLLDAIGAPIEVDGAAFRMSASIGIALGRRGGSSVDLLSEADLAMYAAKRAGKGRYALFEPSLQAASRQRLDLHRELLGALERDELVLHYQPIVALQGGRIESVEALIRWVHPTRGLVPPMQFIPIAEETGLITRIGEWVLRDAIASVAAWRRLESAQELGICVNVSVHQLSEPSFAELVGSILADAGIPPSALTMEITESVFADPSRVLTTNLEALRLLGVRVAIDDFGTGYSALGYLPRLPVDTLKIDRSFMADAASDEMDPALPGAIIRMAAALGLRTIAEGAETNAQLDGLRSLGCDAVQGYVLSRPVPSDGIVAILEDDHLWEARSRDEDPAADGARPTPGPRPDPAGSVVDPGGC